MTEQWQELKETIKELRCSNGDLTQQEVCSFLGVYMETLEKQMQESTYAKGTIIKSALKYLVKRQIEEGSVGFAVDNDHDHDCCWDDVLTWIEAQPCEDCISREEAINEADNLSLETSYDNEKVEQMLRDLPPVTPKYTDEEIDKAQAVEQAYVDKMVELAVEESRREWLNSFDTNSATKCFEAVNILKERLEKDGNSNK